FTHPALEVGAGHHLVRVGKLARMGLVPKRIRRKVDAMSRPTDGIAAIEHACSAEHACVAQRREDRTPRDGRWKVLRRDAAVAPTKREPESLGIGVDEADAS